MKRKRGTFVDGNDSFLFCFVRSRLYDSAIGELIAAEDSSASAANSQAAETESKSARSAPVAIAIPRSKKPVAEKVFFCKGWTESIVFDGLCCSGDDRDG